MPKESKLGLEELKKKYKELQNKYHLPDFESLNQDFYIEKIAEIETDFLTREIRRFIADRVYNYLRFIETILNPVNAPMFIFSIIKSIDSPDKKKLSEVYSKLSEMNIELIKLDIESNEKKDAEFIIQTYESWQPIKKELFFVVNRFRDNKEIKEDKSTKYFG
jgi:hypothetical protein